MPRPSKCRKVCCLPDYLEFAPVGGGSDQPFIGLTIDEFETVRLIDKEGLSQEECSQRMEVARTTVQQIYTPARKKISVALVEGRALKIGGGNYQLCEGNKRYCGCGGCRRHKCMREKESITDKEESE